MKNKMLLALLLCGALASPRLSLAQVDYNCGVGTVTVNGVTSTNKAWLLSGSTTTSSDYFGTYNNDDIRISTNNASCNFDQQKQRMLITAGSAPGNVSIGMWDGANNPTVPQNKLLVENGAIISGGPYPLLPFSPNQVGILSVSNDAAGTNVASLNFIQQNSASNSIGSASLISGDGSNNLGHAAIVSGDNNSGANGNTGVFTLVSGTNSINTGLQANVTGGGTASNTGLQLLVGIGTGTSGQNYGVVSQVTGSSYQNLAVHGEVSGTASGGNIGVEGFATDGASNFGVNGLAHGDNTFNQGIYGQAYGSASGNCGAVGVILGNSNSGSTCTGVLGVINASGDGSANYGVEGDLSAISSPAAATPYYSIYGRQTTPPAGSSNTITTIPSGDMLFAGYFEGDVFASNYYYPSDPKLKKNVREYTGALDALSQLPVKEYIFRTEEYSKMNLPLGRQFGIMAPDFKKVFPSLVKDAMHPAEGKGGTSVSFEAVNYNALIPVLVQAVKELGAKPDNKDLAKKVEVQEAQLSVQAQQIADQNKQIGELRTMLNDICTNGCAGFSAKGSGSPTQGAVLYQSVPNPASGAATIGYTINIPYTTAFVRIVSMDGRIIAEYNIKGQGAGAVSFDTNAIAAGTYKYYLIIDDNITDVKSMAVISK